MTGSIRVINLYLDRLPKGTRIDRVDRGSASLGNPFPMRAQRECDYVVKGFRRYLWLVAEKGWDPVAAAQKVARELGLVISDRWLKGKVLRSDVLNALDELLTRLKKGDDIILGCHCDPDPCHGHIIANYLRFRLGFQQLSVS